MPRVRDFVRNVHGFVSAGIILNEPLAQKLTNRVPVHCWVGAALKGERISLGVPWPPPVRVPLTKEESALKLHAIRAHSTHLAGATDPAMIEERAYLESFVKSEEVFWTVPR